MDSAIPCTVCNTPGHVPRKCPTLHEMLKEGFYSGGGGGGGHSHDDDEKVTTEVPPPVCPIPK
jgi:hypothetical protein